MFYEQRTTELQELCPPLFTVYSTALYCTILYVLYTVYAAYIFEKNAAEKNSLKRKGKTL